MILFFSSVVLDDKAELDWSIGVLQRFKGKLLYILLPLVKADCLQVLLNDEMMKCNLQIEMIVL